MGYGKHIEIPDMGSDPPIDIIFNDDIVTKKIVRKCPVTGDKESLVVCSCKTWAGTAVYKASLCEYITLKENYWQVDHGRIKHGVFYRRPRYAWVRLEISKKAADIMNKAFKKAKFITEAKP